MEQASAPAHQSSRNTYLKQKIGLKDALNFTSMK